MLKALIFDFDGLILDTETPELETWQSIYRENGHELSAHTWGQIVGGTAASTFEPGTHLASLNDRAGSPEDLRARANRESLTIIHSSSPLPGVRALLDDARRKGLSLAVASSSPHTWVDGHLQRLGLFQYFNVVKCREDVQRTKPYPDLFLAAAKAMQVKPEEAIIFEDSPNGVLAANRAGIFVVAVPNPTTRQLKFEGVNLMLDSLSGFSLSEMVVKFS